MLCRTTVPLQGPFVRFFSISGGHFRFTLWRSWLTVQLTNSRLLKYILPLTSECLFFGLLLTIYSSGHFVRVCAHQRATTWVIQPRFSRRSVFFCDQLCSQQFQLFGLHHHPVFYLRKSMSESQIAFSTLYFSNLVIHRFAFFHKLICVYFTSYIISANKCVSK